MSERCLRRPLTAASAVARVSRDLEEALSELWVQPGFAIRAEAGEGGKRSSEGCQRGQLASER